MKIIEVTNKITEKMFLQFPRALYKNDPNWVCPLDKDIVAVFDPVRNSHYKEGEACRWVLENNQGNIIGRISAFYSKIKILPNRIRTGGIGHFECIEDQKAANMLFDTAKHWLETKGMQAMDGPVNFGENDSNWGLLVEGFTHPAYGMPYHHPYYKKLFENYGFQIFFKQYSYHLDLNKKFPERFWKIAEWICRKPGFTFKHFTWKEVDKYIDDMVQIYNQAWSNFKEDYTPLNPVEVKTTLRKAKPILDEELIWFAYHNNEPIGFFIMFPDINQILKKMNGKLHLWNKVRFFYYKKIRTINRIRAQVAGVIPKFQNSGVESGIFWNLRQVMDHKPHYQEVELSWVGDFNPKMIALYEAVGGVRAKTHHTYRFMIDKNLPFERFMSDMVDVPLAQKKAKQVAGK
jgi:hypothetical protein